MKNWKTYLGIVVIVILIWLLKSWWIPKVIIGLGGYTVQETKKETSRTSTISIDTLAVFNKFVQTKGINLNPKPIIKYKYEYLNPVTKEKEEIDSVKSFTVKVKDSLIDGNMFITNNMKGDLLESELIYKALFPKYIERVETITETTTETNTLSNELRSKIGIGIGANSLLSPSILGSYTTKKDLQFIGEYNFIPDFQDIRINNKEVNQIISLKIIKSW